MDLRLSALRAGRALLPEISAGAHSCYRQSKLQSHSTAGKFRKIEKFSDRSVTRSRYLLACKRSVSTIHTFCTEVGKTNGVWWMLRFVALVRTLTRATRRNIPGDAILHSHRRRNLKS
jgi:hypothetical protein